MSMPTDNTDLQPQPHETGGPPAELPPVEPPTAGFILQLFVLPAVIVAVVIVVWLLFGVLASGERDPMEYVETIRSGNENRRWRAAHELASLISNSESLGRDPALLGKLTDLLDQELSKDGDARLKVYLAVALGVFQTLDASPSSGHPVDPVATLTHALDAKQPAEVRRAAAESLAKQAARLDGKLENAEAERALAEASEAPEPELRKRATFALGFFKGNDVDEWLRKRVHDEDREVRYNAATALGRRGDPAALPIFREMLSSDLLNQVITLENPEEKQSQIETIEVAALRSLQTSVQRGRPTLGQLLRSEVQALASSPLVSVRMEAEAVLKSLPASLAPASTETPAPKATPATP
ncbi:MAG TPA: HEAT repeat domain-containing protein [Isosphaeraceae bacterium]|nr:HEAT repeat domain-containing protein [Isosphaeraceae bacterium]